VQSNFWNSASSQFCDIFSWRVTTKSSIKSDIGLNICHWFLYSTYLLSLQATRVPWVFWVWILRILLQWNVFTCSSVWQRLNDNNCFQHLINLQFQKKLKDKQQCCQCYFQSNLADNIGFSAQILSSAKKAYRLQTYLSTNLCSMKWALYLRLVLEAKPIRTTWVKSRCNC